MKTPDDCYTISEFADLFGVSVSTVRSWIHDRKIPYRTDPGGSRKYISKRVAEDYKRDRFAPNTQSPLKNIVLESAARRLSQQDATEYLDRVLGKNKSN